MDMPIDRSPQRGFARLRAVVQTAALAVLLCWSALAPATAAVLAGWDVHGLAGGSGSYGASPLAASTADAHLVVGGLTRGSGVGVSGTAAARGWGGNDWLATGAAAAVSGGDYASFSVAAASGYQVSFGAISRFDYRRSTSGASNGVLQYQLGNGAYVDIATLNYSSTSSSGGSLAAIDLSGIAALQNVPAGTTVTFRVVNYGGTSASGTWYVFDTANTTAADLEVQGTVSPAALQNGACGADDAKVLAAVAPTNLCNAGIASGVTGGGHPWTWSCAGTGGGSSASCSASITSYAVGFSADANGSLSGATSQTVDYGASASAVTAVGNAGYVFSNWTGSNGFTSTANPLVLANVTGAQQLVAHFIAGQAKGPFTIYHVNDTHARVTPHKWIIPSHANTPASYEDVGGAAFLAGKMLALTAADPQSLVIDAGDISEGNPIGDMNGNASMTQFYQMLSAKLLAQRGRGMDAVVVGNHDVRDASYIQNLVALKNAGVPVLSVNVRDITTHQPYFAPYNIVTVNGTKVGILGYTTSSSEVGASLASTLEVVDCDWTGTSAPCHLADYVNELRNTQHVDVVVLVAHIGHSAMVDPNPSVAAPLLVDDGTAKLPEAVVAGHWHTWAETVWQPMELNYKTIFTESSSYMKYIGELKLSATGAYVGSNQHVIRNAEITPDPDVQTFVNNLITQYDNAHPGHPVNEVVGYTADNLMLDNEMRWWSPNEYPWSGNNTAGQWITDAMRWKAEQLFGQCDLAVEAGGGVRADIPAGPVTYMQVYETFPWNDDTFYRVNMSGQEIVNFLKATTMDAGFSSDLDVTAADGVPTSVKFKGQPIDLAHTYTVAINNYMYQHPPSGFSWSDANPVTNAALVRDGIVDFMRSQHGTAATAYQVGGDRYHLNGEFSGGYRAVVTMMDDADTRPTFDKAFVRLLSATPETLLRRGQRQVPVALVGADGSVNQANRFSEMEVYRSFLGFKPGLLKQGDIIEIWGKAGFYDGDPEFVEQEGIQADGVEFKVLGHDASLAKPVFFGSIAAFMDDDHKNHYVQFLGRKTAADTVIDQFGQSLKIWDATAYTAAVLPGNIGDVLLVSGVPTMENFALRFRRDAATVSSASLPAVSSLRSHVDALPVDVSGALTLSATVDQSAVAFSLAPVADAQVASGKPTANYGSSTNLYLQSSASGYGDERAWLKFDLSSLPAGTNITGATLQLWNFRAAGAALPVEARGGADDTWTESGLTWNTQPAFGAALDTQTLAQTSSLWYSWNVGSLVQQKWAGNKLVSILLKPVSEGSTDATAPSYAFDAKEYGSNAPMLSVRTQTSSAPIANLKFYYRYSADNLNWGAWTLGATATAAPYQASFAFPQGHGYYEFYSVATDSQGNTEAAPAAAQAAVHHQAASGQTQTISFAALAPTTVGTSVALSATASSGLPVTFSSQTAAVCTVAGNQVSTITAGTCTVAADQAGAAGYWLAASTVTRNFVVNLLAQTIDFAAPADQRLGNATVTVVATASSGLPVTVATLTAQVCTVSGNTVSLIAAGTCTLSASQAGDATHAAAPTIVRSFAVSSETSAQDGDVPLPAWALAALGFGLLGALRRRSAAH